MWGRLEFNWITFALSPLGRGMRQVNRLVWLDYPVLRTLDRVDIIDVARKRLCQADSNRVPAERQPRVMVGGPKLYPQVVVTTPIVELQKASEAG